MFDVGCKERKDERNDIVVSRFHKILASGFGVLLLEVETRPRCVLHGVKVGAKVKEDSERSSICTLI